MPDNEEILSFMRRLALEAGARAAAFYTRSNSKSSKAGGEPVTVADVAVNNLIVDAITKHFPDDGILAEESKVEDGRSTKGAVWIVDPIDGTREFIAGTGQFAIHIARVVDEVPVLGVVYQAACHRMFYGGQDVGAFVEQNGKRLPLRVSTETNPKKMTLAVSRAHMSKRVKAVVKELQPAATIPAGGVGIKACKVATADCDLYLHPSGATSQWDAAAPDAIVRAAGGTVSDLLGSPLAYGAVETKLLLGIAVTNGRVHDEILQIISPVITAWQDKVKSQAPA